MDCDIPKENLLPLIQNNNLMEILPQALNIEKEDFRITPSEFIKELSLTTEERHKKMVHIANGKKILHMNYPPDFKVIPSIIIFQNFEARNSYTVTLIVRNIGKALSPLKMECSTSTFFCVTPIGPLLNKLAPGLSMEYHVNFTPKEEKDYSYQINFKSRDETFSIPIVAIGPRPMLDIPDQIFLKTAPVKIPTNKFIVLRNIGKVPAVFSFICQSPLFKMNPTKGVLRNQDSMLINISFESANVEEVTETACLTLETGERLSITLHGSAENIGVRLDKTSVFHEDTYLGMKRFKTIRLVNSSDSVLKFSWKKHKTIEEDMKIIESMKEKYKELCEYEVQRGTKIEYYELNDFPSHKISCERILKDELQILMKEEFGFFHEAFTIMPQSGEVWPNSFTEILISFEPKVCGPISAEAYAEISGRSSRLPLKIKGNGLGPKIALNTKNLDIDYIFLCSLHRYEIIANNTGDIPGTIKYIPKHLVFGGKVNVEPEFRYLKPGECAAFVVSLTSNRQGDFIEQLEFKISESDDSLILVLKGKIISPTLHFDIRQIDFGIIPVGFPTVREVTLNNLSVVPVTFSLRILSDGDSPSISVDQFARLSIKPVMPVRPKQFQIEPEESVVEPFSSKLVTLTLTANKAGHFITNLVVDMWDSENGSVSLPIYFHPQIPNIVIDPEVIAIPFCFINFPYTRSINVRNVSKTPGFFYFVPMNPNEDTPMTCSPSIPQGVIEPRSFIKVDVTVMTSAVGRHDIPMKLIVFGVDNPKEVCSISCVGQGPVITVSPNSMVWGDLQLLEESTKTLVVINECPIPAAINILLGKPYSPWTVTPSHFTLNPDKSAIVTVKLRLINRGKFKDVIKVRIHNGKVLLVPMNATGVGSSLRITPTISPTYALGTLFSHKKYEFTIKLENKGTKNYGLVWSPFPDYKTFANAKMINPPYIVFKFEPSKIDVSPGEVKEVYLEVFSPTNGFFSKTFYCFANIGVPTKELHLTSEVSAEFIEPVITFDKQRLNYWYNVGCDGMEQKLEDEVEITNKSYLPIITSISAKYPFCVVTAQGSVSHNLEIILQGSETKKLKIRFVVELIEDNHSRIFKENLLITFQEYSKSSSISLHGEVNYPNVIILPNTINFGHTAIGTNSLRETTLINISPLTVYYEITWNPLKCRLENLEKIKTQFTNESRSTNGLKDLDDYNNEYGSFENGEEEQASEDQRSNSSKALIKPIKPVLNIPEVSVSTTKIKAALYSLIRTYHKSNEELMNVYNLENPPEIKYPDPVPQYAKICDITPFYGKLEKFSSQTLLIQFCADTAVKIHAEALVNVLLGPSEVIKIDGFASKIKFQLSQVEFDFGMQLFCETKNQTLKIKNKGTMPFTFEVHTDVVHACKVSDEISETKGALTISPRTGEIRSYSDAELTIQNHPGIPGKFIDKFYLQISYIDPILITVKGCGVFPQVHISLPRPEMRKISPEIGYVAVANTTPEWFLTGFIADESDNSCLLKAYRSQENLIDSLSKSDESSLLHDGWEYISHLEIYPSTIDIQMSVERVLAGNVITSTSLNNATINVHARVIPQFFVPAYTIDFGITIIGQTVQRNVTLSNYGPLNAVLYLFVDSSLKEMGIHIRLKNRTELKIGTCLPFTAYFHPRKKRFKNRVENIDKVFYFEVQYGAKIPIKVVATVTYPYVITSLNVLNFRAVSCGCCKMMVLKMKNPLPYSTDDANSFYVGETSGVIQLLRGVKPTKDKGLVPVSWTMAVSTKTGDISPRSKFADGKDMFSINSHSGSLNPGEYDSVQVYFKPEYGVVYSTSLWIHIAQSIEDKYILLLGEGVEPKVKIRNRILNFGPTLPYPMKLEEIFTVENPCPFPVEFYFPIFDEQIFEEEKIIRAVCYYYQTRELLLPVRQPGEGLPIELVNFYQMLLDDLSAKYVEEEREKAELLEDSVSTVLLNEEGSSILSQSSYEKDKKKKKSKKSFSRSRTSFDSNHNLGTAQENASETNLNFLFERKTSMEIEEMIKDHTKNLELQYDPIQAVNKNILPPVEKEECKPGTLIIFHGAPFTNSLQLANQTAMVLNIPVLSIDRIVLEEAALSRSDCGAIAKELIEQAYWTLIEPRNPVLEKEEWGEAQEMTFEDSFFPKVFDEITHKFEALVSLRETKTTAKAQPKGAKPSSTKSEDSKKLDKSTTATLKQTNVTEPLANITEELVAEILNYRISLDVEDGIVFETLKSQFYNSPVKALLAILKAAGNVKDILAIFLTSNYHDFYQNNLKIQAEKELAKAQFREKVLKYLQEEEEEDEAEIFKILELSEEDAEQFRLHFMHQRRQAQEKFEQNKHNFYKFEKLKREADKKGTPLPVTPVVQKEEPPVHKPQKEKEKKKEGVRSRLTTPAGKRTGSDTKSVKKQKDPIELEFLNFEFEFMEMKAIIDTWDQSIGGPVVESSLIQVQESGSKVKRGQTPRKESKPANSTRKGARGIFFWLVDVSKPSSRSFYSMCNYLKTALPDRNIINEAEKWPLEKTESVNYSVVTFPNIRVKSQALDIYTLTPIEIPLKGEDSFEDYNSAANNIILSRSTSQISLKTKKKACILAKRRKAEQKGPKESRKIKRKKPNAHPSVEENQIQSRWILNPGDSVSFRVKYFPVEPGFSEQKYFLNVVNWRNYNTVECYGKCDLPSITVSPEVTFLSDETAKSLSIPPFPSYSHTEKICNFGSIITFLHTDGRRPMSKKAILYLLNKANLPADVNVILSQDVYADEPVGSNNIEFDPEMLQIPSKYCHPLTITVHPTKLGIITEHLYFFIKGNPKIESISVKFEGVKANVTVEPKHVNFDRLLLHRKDKRWITFANHNQIPLFIVLNGLNNMPSQFNFSLSSGWIPPLGTLMVEINYSATEVQLISERHIEVQVFDKSDTPEAIYELSFIISVEAYDAALDIIFPKKEDDHIDFGEIRVDNNYLQVFHLRNAGKYILGFKIDIDQRFLSDSENDQFFISPHEGKLPPGKTFALNVNFTAQTEVVWKKVPLFKILLVEPHGADELIASIPIEVSARSFFARYEVKPNNEFNFGGIIVNSPATGTLFIENKGHFSLTYHIVAKPTSRSEASVDLKSSKVSATSRDKSKKIPVESIITIGNFEVSPIMGTAEPGQAAVINITCFPDEVKIYKEKIIIFVNESIPPLKKGNLIHLTAEGCLPLINFKDIKSVFREHFICKTEEDFKQPKRHGFYTLYTDKSPMLVFNNICVCKTEEARIHLSNIGQIQARVEATIEPSTDTRGNHHATADTYTAFDISPIELVIEPYNSGTLIVTCQPQALQDYKAKLTIVQSMPEGWNDIVRTIELYARGILPQIEITEPKSKLAEGQTFVNFPITSPGHFSTTSVAFTNVGTIDCKIILEIFKNEENIFSLIPKPGTENMLKVWELSRPINHTVIVSIFPEQTAEFFVRFSPQEVKRYTAQIKVIIVDNPFENLSCILSGDVFVEEVIIDKFRTTLPFLSEENSISPKINESGQYILNFNNCFVNKKSSALCKLVNLTEKDFFKFEWQDLTHISISPKYGHLYPSSYKEILLVFHPEEQMEIVEAPLTCILNKIIFENAPDPSWDSRLLPYSKKSSTSGVTYDSASFSDSSTDLPKLEEPEHMIIPETTKLLVLNISAIADYAQIACNISNIVFKKTFMFQNRSHPFVLENIGKVPIRYKASLRSLNLTTLKESRLSQINSKSFSRLKFPGGRPQSSTQKSLDSANYHEQEKESVKSKQRRPLTSVSFLDLRTNPSESEDKNDDLLQMEESKLSPYNPFSLENSVGQILPGETATCKIIFSPMDISDYKAIVTIRVPNLHPGFESPEIEVMASSEMPYCHFNITESDYLESGRRDFSRPGPIGYSPGLPLNPDTKTIEIKVLGLGQTVPIKFHAINPTNEEYLFSWVNNTQLKADKVSSFHCSTLGGKIQAGRQQLMAFTFVSQKIGIEESFWKFCIPKYELETQFLFVGDVHLPSVFCLTTHINLRPTIIGSSSADKLTLVNHEKTPFEFYFLPDSIYAEGRTNALKVEPMTGKIPPQSEINVRVTFTGKIGGKSLFYLKCKVKTIKEVFTISVETMTYVVQPLIVFEDLKKNKHYADSSVDNIIDFGTELVVNRPETISLFLTSLSKISFNYDWEFQKSLLESRSCKIKFTPKTGQVTSFSRKKCDLTIVFSKKSSLNNYPLQLKIKKGPIFNFLIRAVVSMPLCEFSFNSYDFGYCFIQEKDVCFYDVQLVIKNKNPTDIFLECNLSENSAFSYKLPSAVVPAEKEIIFTLKFHPKECIPYSDVIKFLINGIHEKIVDVKGHGTDFKVTLVDPEFMKISLGAVRVGKTAERQFCLVNKSLASATVLLGFSYQLPVRGLYLRNSKENFVNTSENHRLTNIITISPSTPFTLKPQETCAVTITYTPQYRKPPFTETVALQFQERTEPVCVLTGCCLGPEISLDRHCLNFGAIVVTCNNVLKLKIVNSGNIGARFEWHLPSTENEFSIMPVSGYCSPESFVTIQVTFNPTVVRHCLRVRAECKLFLSENETYPSQFVDLVGDCIAIPHPSQTIIFKCYVRESDTKLIEIENTSGTEWKLLPTMAGEYFKGVEVLIVQPLTSSIYKVNYCPLTMTKDEEFHEGSVFFRLPNGKGLLYNLKGTSLPPNAEEIIVREVPCKTKYVELLKVQNWMQYPQRFKVQIMCFPPENQEELFWDCSGLEFTEVPANILKEYSLNFFAYKIGTLRFEVKFINRETKEFLWYDITFNVVMCGPLEVITMKSGVRQSCYHELKLENPLTKPISYELETTTPEVHFESTTYEVPPEQNIYVRIEFLPVLVREQTAKLNAMSQDLGLFPRELRLISVEVQPEPPKTFITPLGNSLTQNIPIKNYSHLNAVLMCRINCEEFVAPEKLTLPAGETTNIKVTHEPSEFGTTTATLFVESPQAGNFIFQLLGICEKPLAKGPFIINPSSTLIIPFKNVFKTAKDFYMYVDNPAFILKSSNENIMPKEEYKITITLQKIQDLEQMEEYKDIEIHYPVMGQLVVECFSPYVKWQFYLKGILK